MAQITDTENKIFENEVVDGQSSEKDQPATNQKTKFQMECERGVSIEDARAHTHEFIKQLWKK